eukprot:snap_masked-scaffold_30-processed-gene-3.79-mRNA-1 protein AED:1.00 eAED:1.00 QI:0/-1/0/0/-1/1/1/0/61
MKPLLPDTLVWWLNPTLRKFDADTTIWRVLKAIGNNIYEVKNIESEEMVKVSGRNLIPLCM